MNKLITKKSSCDETVYYNKDLAPKTKNEKTWGIYAFFSCWVAMNVCIPSYQMASSAIAMGLSWWISLVLVFLGNTIILIPILLNAKPGIKYGISFPLYLRSVFGIKGAHLPVIIRSIIGSAWTGILIWVGAESLNVALTLLFNEWETFTYGQLVCFVLFWFLNIGLTLSGSNILKKLECISVPILGVFCVGLLIWGITTTKQIGCDIKDAIIVLQSNTTTNLSGTIIIFLVANISFYSTWAINSSDISCYAKNEKSHHVGVTLGLPFSMVAIAFFGIYITGVSKLVYGEAIWNPNDLILKIGNKWAAVIAALAICLETLNTNVVTNILPPANGFSNLLPKKLSYKHGVIITGIISILIKPWELVADPNGYIYDWLNFYGILTGPIASILLCDYFLFKKQKILVEHLYCGNKSKYWYYKGYNLLAIISWFFSIIPSILGLIFSELVWLREYGWIVSFILGFFIYFSIKKFTLRRVFQ